MYNQTLLEDLRDSIKLFPIKYLHTVTERPNLGGDDDLTL